MTTKLPGLIVSLTIAFAASVLSYIHPSLEALAISILLGMLLSNILRDRDILASGIDISIKIFLPLGIALYGSQLTVKELHFTDALYVLLTFISVFTLVFLMSRGFGLKKNTSVLLATGMSVCGASAIAIVSSLIKAEKEETSISLIVVTVSGLVGLVFYPLIADFLNLTIKEFAFLSGTTLPMLGQVKVTAMTFGEECLSLALRYKLLRMSFLIFVVTVAVLLARTEKKRIYVPWFVVAFIGLAVVVNLLKNNTLPRVLEPFSRFFLSTALAAIGLSVDFDAITEKGFAPLFAVFFASIILVTLFYIIFTVV